MAERQPLKDILSTVNYWHQVSPGHFAPAESPAPPVLVEHTYQVVEFSEIEPRLTQVWVGFNAETDVISGNALRMQIAFWKNPTVWLPATDKHDKPAAVYRFHSFSCKPADEMVMLSFERMVMSKNDRGVYYPCYPEPATGFVPRAWLDEHLPQWEERYAMALSLDLGPADLTQLLLEKPEQRLGVALPDIRFE